jgi:hypothetical protein
MLLVAAGDEHEPLLRPHVHTARAIVAALSALGRDRKAQGRHRLLKRKSVGNEGR